jgi:uncharacterized protein YlaI
MSNYRNPKLLALAKKAPRCMSCGKPNDGTVVACHSNAQRHGKGMGLKAHDLPAFLCRECHDYIDGRNQRSMTGWDTHAGYRQQVWADAMFQSFLWLLQEGHLEVTR